MPKKKGSLVSFKSHPRLPGGGRFAGDCCPLLGSDYLTSGKRTSFSYMQVLVGFPLKGGKPCQVAPWLAPELSLSFLFRVCRPKPCCQCYLDIQRPGGKRGIVTILSLTSPLAPQAATTAQGNHLVLIPHGAGPGECKRGWFAFLVHK